MVILPEVIEIDAVKCHVSEHNNDISRRVLQLISILFVLKISTQSQTPHFTALISITSGRITIKYGSYCWDNYM